MIEDVINESESKLINGNYNNVNQIRSSKFPVICFSKNTLEDNEMLRSFLQKKMYRHTIVNRMTIKAKSIVTDLFRAFSSDFSILPTEWRDRIALCDKSETYRLISDYIAGMTDRYAIMEHKRLFDLHGGWSGTSLYDKRDR
jgi:dGTPase